MPAVPFALAGLALVLASCGGQEFPQTAGTPTAGRPAGVPQAATRDPQAWLLASVQRTSALKSARLALSMKLDGLGNETMSATGNGEMDFANHEASLSVRGSENGQPITLDLRLVGGTLYMRTDREWRSRPATEADVNTPNPASYIAYLRAVSADVRVEGHETLRGVDTIRYGADIDFDHALAHAANPADRKQFAQALTMLGGLKMPTTVWIDGDGRLRKLQFSLDLAAAFRKSALSVAGDPKMTVGLEFYDFGIPVHVVPPTGALDAAAAAQTQSDLRNALVAEKVFFTDHQVYSADLAGMKRLEPSLDWGGKLKVVVGNTSGSRGWVVCLSQASPAGPVFAIATVAGGPDAGTYYGRSSCPDFIDGVSVARLGPRW
jgi:hypothetical protein